MNHNFYVGREYIHQLKENNINFDIISFGNNEDMFDDDPRCKGLWKPKPFNELIKGLNHYNFNSLNDESFLSFLDHQSYDLGIQGGTGILKTHTINQFSIGIMNFHPGDLPQYRGCSCPEWQIVEGKKVIATAHFITEGIDDGPVLLKKVLDLDYSSYEKMRSTIYSEIAKIVPVVINEVFDNGIVAVNQDHSSAIYRNVISNDKILDLQENWNKYISNLYKDKK